MGRSKRKYESEFKMMLVKKVVFEGMTTVDTGKLYSVSQQRIHDWAKNYIITGNTDFITGQKTEKEIQRDRLLWKVVTLVYHSNKYKAQADELNKEIEAEKTEKSGA